MASEMHHVGLSWRQVCRFRHWPPQLHKKGERDALEDLAGELTGPVRAGDVRRARDDVKPSDEGKAAEFKGKTVDLKEKGEFAIVLTCTAGKEVTATTKGDKETDVHLFIYAEDKKEVGKDTSPGPKCEVKFTPAKDGKFKLLVRNLGLARTR